MSEEHPIITGMDGEWIMARADSKVRDPETGLWIEEPILEQIVDHRHDGAWEIARVRIQHAPDLTMYLRYRARLDDSDWVPYEIFHIDGDTEHESLRPNQFRKVHARVGQPIAFLKKVYVDPRTYVRVTRHPNGLAQYMLMARLSEDGERLVATVSPADGDAGIAKAMVRYTGPALTWPDD